MWDLCDVSLLVLVDRKCGVCTSCDADAVMSIRFREEEFQAAWKELDAPQLEGGWELFTETLGVAIYRRYRQVPARNRAARLTPRPNRFGFQSNVTKSPDFFEMFMSLDYFSRVRLVGTPLTQRSAPTGTRKLEDVKGWNRTLNRTALTELKIWSRKRVRTNI